MNQQLAFDVQLSVIVPAYNEEDRIASGIRQILEFLQSKQKHTWELIVVDDGSEDNTCHIIDAIISGDNLSSVKDSIAVTIASISSSVK